MKVEVLLEEFGDRRFRAWTSRPFELSVEGATDDESVASLKQLLNDRLSRVRVIEVEAGTPTENPLRALQGYPEGIDAFRAPSVARLDDAILCELGTQTEVAGTEPQRGAIR